MILDPGKSALARSRHVGPHVIVVQVKSDVAIEVPVTVVTGVTFVFAPDLAGRFEIAPKRRYAIGGKYRREHPIPRPGTRMEQSVCVDDEPANVRLLQHFLDSIDIGAFRQPNSARLDP